MFNIFEEILWPQYIKLEGINKLPLYEQINSYNQYLYNLDIARQNFIDTQNKGPLPESTPQFTFTFEITIGSDNDYFTFNIGTTEDGSTDVIVDWGDGSPRTSGSIEPLDSEAFRYDYPTAGSYTVGVICTEPSSVYSLVADQND